MKSVGIALFLFAIQSQSALAMGQSDAYRAAMEGLSRELATTKPPTPKEAKNSPASTAAALAEMANRDQIVRNHYFGPQPTIEDSRAIAAATEAIGASIQVENTKLLEEILPKDGWFKRSIFGDQASRDAMLILMHSDDSTQEKYLKNIEKLAHKNEVVGEDYIILYDKVQINHGKPQKFGTQVTCKDGMWSAWPLEDEKRVDAFRNAYGVKVTFAEYIKKTPVGRACGVR